MFSNLFRLSFWFDLSPVTFSPLFERGLFLLFALLAVVAAAIRIVARKKTYDRDTTRVFLRVATMMTTMSILGFIWFFFSFEEIYIFGARFFFLIWVLGVLYWSYTIYRFAKYTLPEERLSAGVKESVNKYLPRRK